MPSCVVCCPRPSFFCQVVSMPARTITALDDVQTAYIAVKESLEECSLGSVWHGMGTGETIEGLTAAVEKDLLAISSSGLDELAADVRFA